MKTNLKCTSIVFTLLFIILFSSCDKELYEEPIRMSNQAKVSSEKVGFTQVLDEVENPVIKEFITKGIKQEYGFSGARGIYELMFEKFTKESQYVTYSLILNSYTTEKPYFLFFIINKDGEKEEAGFSKYIPDAAVTILDVENFTGRFQILDLDQDVIAQTDFIDSEPQPITEGACYYNVEIIQHNCSNGGDHPPGVPCEGGNINDGYYEVITYIVCPNNPSPYYLAPPPSTFLGSTTPGGGSSLSSNINVLYFLYSLTDEQYNTIANNLEIVTYLEQNDASPESKEFILNLLYIVASNDLELDCSLQEYVNQDINNLDDLSEYVQSINFDVEDDSVGDFSNTTQDQVVGTKTIELSSLIDLTIEVVANTQPNFSLDQDGCKSYISNVVVGNTWVQNSMTITKMDYMPSYAQITILGYNSIGVSLEGLEFGIKQKRKITFLINKTTGELCCSSITKY